MLERPKCSTTLAVPERSTPRTPNALTICHNLLMCGRYRLSRRKQMIEEYFGTVSGEDDWNPRYNIAPTQPVPVIRQNPKEPRAGIVAGALGFDPLVGEGHVRRSHDD